MRSSHASHNVVVATVRRERVGSKEKERRKRRKKQGGRIYGGLHVTLSKCRRKEIRSVTEKLGRGWNLEPSGTVLYSLLYSALPWMCVTNRNRTEKGSHSASRVVCEYQASISIGQAERNAIGLS